jgi:hypothetical protein
MQWIHLLDHALQPWRWKEDGLQKIAFQPPYYMTQPTKQLLTYERLEFMYMLFHQLDYKNQRIVKSTVNCFLEFDES